MAEPRFFDNRGPFKLAELCARAGLDCPKGSSDALVHDVAGLDQAGSAHLSFFDGARARHEFQSTKAGWCLVKNTTNTQPAPPSTVLIPAPSVGNAFASIASAF